jgi:DNA-binding SARP family transcriptional activator
MLSRSYAIVQDRGIEIVFDLQVLGPLKLFVRGVEARLGPKQRVLLLALWLAGGEAISPGRLTELVWDGDEPPGSRMTLRSHVHRLRNLIGHNSGGGTEREAVLVTERVGATLCYALRIPGEMVDAAKFERLATEGRAALADGRFADAAALLGGALGLWRGAALADVAGRPFAVAAITRLEEMRRAAVVARAEADLALGRRGALIGDLRSMLAEWPDDGELLRLLVISLHRAGRQAEAAQACREAIELALSHGLDPSDLQALQHAVLTGSASLADGHPALRHADSRPPLLPVPPS